jgi:hypothetical protein
MGYGVGDMGHGAWGMGYGVGDMGHGAWGGGYPILFVKYDRPSFCINTLSLYRLCIVLCIVFYMVYRLYTI